MGIIPGGADLLHFFQQPPHGIGQEHVPLRQMQQPPLQIHLVPGEVHQLLALHAHLPAHPQGDARGGAVLLLKDLPQTEFIELPPRLCWTLFVRGVPGKAGLEGRDRQAADPDGIGPVVLLQLAEKVVPAQIFQLDLGQASRSQGISGNAGDGLRPQRLPELIGNHHIRGHCAAVFEAGSEASGSLFLQRDRPVLQKQTPLLKIHLGPFQGDDLLPAESLEPGQAEDEPRQVLRMLVQELAHILFIRLAELVSHSASPGVRR